MEWTEPQRAELAREYSRVGYVAGELWPAPPEHLNRKIFSHCFAGSPMVQVVTAMLRSSQRPGNEDMATQPNELRVSEYIPHMIRHRSLVDLNAFLLDADRGQQRVAFGLAVACLLIGPSLSAFPWTTLWVAVVLLLPRRAA